MCGIAACIRNKGSIDRVRFESMTDIVDYRGPDDRGTFYEGNLALGHRRLSIIDLSADGHQPFELTEGFALVFNGEIYNYIELREELSAKNHVFKTKTDTEVIIEAYREWNDDCVSHFDGMWAFVLYDKKNKRLFCSRDRFGIKPFYYTEQEEMFLIGSEIKQFFEMLSSQPRANKHRLMQYIIRGIIDVVPYTLFEDIYQLEPGHNLIYNLIDNKYSIRKYYELNQKKYIFQKYEDACEVFRKNFFEAVQLRLRADVPVGYFLSGGLDSSAIVCVANRIINEHRDSSSYDIQHTVSSCYPDKRYDEQDYIDEVVRNTSVISHKVYPNDDMLWENLDKIIWHMDEPLSGMSAFSQWSVCEATKEIGLKVIMDGQGSDEQLAGYTDFYTVYFTHLLKKGKFIKLNREIKAYLNLRGRTEPDVSTGRIVLSAFKDLMTPTFLDKFFKMIFMKRVSQIPFSKSEINDALCDEYIYPRRNVDEYIKSYMSKELISILHHLDRKSMAFSIETRNPFMDYRLIENIYSMDIEYKIRNGYTKAVLRDGLDGVIPDLIKQRISKLAFVAPQEKWMNDFREKYRAELLKSMEGLAGLLDVEKVIKWFDSKQTISRADSLLIWRIIDAGRWIKVFDVRV